MESPVARIPNEGDLEDSQDLTPIVVSKLPGINSRKGSINDLPKMKVLNLNHKSSGIKINMSKISQLQ